MSDMADKRPPRSAMSSKPARVRRRVALAIAICGVTVGTAAFVVPHTLSSRSGAEADHPRGHASSGPGSRTPAPAASRDSRVWLRATIKENAGCGVSAKLVPECGAWWGVAPASFTSTPRTQALHAFEHKIGRPVDIYHAYHTGNQVFPTQEEMAIAREPGKKRILLLNWKPDIGHSWAAVAGGAADGQIDKLAAHIKATFPEKFFLVIHHEPEEEVRQTAGSGHTALDFRNMFRHVVKRFRARGVGNAVFTVVYMGSQKWGVQPWFDQLYPGNDVVDWVGMDPYASPDIPDFAHLVNQTSTQGRGFPGFYNWARAIAPGKPIMISEWGAFSSGAHKSAVYRSVGAQLERYPRIKAMVYFDTPSAPFAGITINTSIDTTAAALAAYQKVGNDPQLNP